MPFKLVNHVHEETQSSGNGVLNLDGPIANHLGISSQLSDGDTTILAVWDDASPPALEIVGWTWNDTPSRITPTGTLYFSTTGSLISWPVGGTRNVSGGLPAEVLTSLVLPSLGTGLIHRTAQDVYDVASVSTSGLDLIDEASFDTMLSLLGGQTAGIAVFKALAESTIRTQLETPRFREGVIGDRGTPGDNPDSWYFATDEQELFYSNGSSWARASHRTPRGHLAGLTLSFSDGDTYGVAVGEATTLFGGDPILLGRLDSAFAKNTTGAWAEGTGLNGLATGATLGGLAFIFGGAKADGTMDFMADDNVAGSNVSGTWIGSGFGGERRIAMLPLSGGNMLDFTQDGDRFELATPLEVFAVSGANYSTQTTIQLATNCPHGPGVRLRASVIASNINLSSLIVLGSTGQTLGTPSVTAAPGASIRVDGGTNAAAILDLFPDANRNIEIRVDGDTNIDLRIILHDWWDRRGKDD